MGITDNVHQFHPYVLARGFPGLLERTRPKQMDKKHSLSLRHRLTRDKVGGVKYPV